MEGKNMVSLGGEQNKTNDRFIAISGNFAAILQTNLAELKPPQLQEFWPLLFKLAQVGSD